MPIPTGIENLSTTPASNNPAGSENVSEGDDHLRNLYAFLRQSFTAGADIASASTITPPSTGGSFNLTGTTTVTAIATTNSWSGRKIRFRHTGAHSFTQSSSLVCPGGVSITFANGDISEWAQNPSGGWEIVTYVPVLYISAPYFNATGTTIPAVGIYRPSANTLGFAANTTLFASMNSSGAWTFSPSGGNAITINSSLNNGINITDATVTGVFYTAGAGGINFGTTTAHALNLLAGNAIRVSIASAGNVTINATSGIALSIPQAGANRPLSLTNTGANDIFVLFKNTVTATGVDVGQAADGNFYIYHRDAASIIFGTNNVTRCSVNSTGNWAFTAPASGVSVTVSAVSGTHSTKIADSANNSFNAGFLEVPQNIQSGNYTLVLSDSGKHLLNSGAAFTWTIPANASVAYPIGTVLTFVNQGSGNITIAITTDTLIFSPGGASGSRTLAVNGRASAIKYGATFWQITGTGLT